MILFLKKIIKFIISKKRNYIYSLDQKRIINLYHTKFTNNALLSYQPASFFLPRWFNRFKTDSIYERNRVIAKILKKNGFNVDVIFYKDYKFSPKKEYDLIFDIDVLYKNIYIKQNKKPKIILHYTTSYYEFHNKQQQKRINNFNLKTRKNINIERPLDTNNDGEFANIILSMGNDFTKSTFPKKLQSKVVSIPNFPMHYLSKYKKHKINEINKKNFLFMASRGSILKGLDILLDVFSRDKKKNFNLYVCGSFENESQFMNYYSKYFKLKNIHKIGWINLFKKEFHKIIDKCSFHIFPSCTEGMPGALISTMNVGIIPICTKESGLNMQNDELIIENNPDSIVDVINKVSQMSLSELKLIQCNSVKQSSLFKKQYIQILENCIKEVLN